MAPWTSASGAVSPSGRAGSRPRQPSPPRAWSRSIHRLPSKTRLPGACPSAPARPSPVWPVACGQQTAQPQRNVKKVKPIKSRACFFHARTCSTGLAFPLPCTCWLPCVLVTCLVHDLSFSPHAGDVRGWLVQEDVW